MPAPGYGFRAGVNPRPHGQLKAGVASDHREAWGHSAGTWDWASVGTFRPACSFITNILNLSEQAIEFVRSQRDEELWDYLITWALGSSETTGLVKRFLFQRFGGFHFHASNTSWFKLILS